MGVDIAIEFVPDLIICDVLMNEMDGYKVLQLILENPKTCKIPFIFSTSNSEKVDRKEALALGADDYIIKPFALEALLLMSKNWITSGSKRPK
jgi:CheY-like chemotaxis protein